MSILNKIAKNSVNTAVEKVQMSDQQVELLKTKLKADRRLNVFPNKFDTKTPYRVTMFDKETNKHKQYGYFTNVDVAAAVGSIVSAYKFGDKALLGNYDEAVVESHEEFKAWMADDRNQEIIACVNM